MPFLEQMYANAVMDKSRTLDTVPEQFRTAVEKLVTKSEN